MATVNYLYRSTKNVANLNIRLLFRDKDKDFVIGAKTQSKISRDYWDNIHGKRLQAIKDIDQRNEYQRVHTELSELESYILNQFDRANPKAVNKEWLKDTIAEYYDPAPEIPKDLVGYIGYYIDYKGGDISKKMARRINVTLAKMERLQKEMGRPILIAEINEGFKKAYTDYCEAEKYSKNTQHREIKVIQTICRHARYLGLETHPQLDGLRIEGETVPHIYLTLEDLEAIENAGLVHDYLNNARDWLLISCHTGQRVSDFMRFTTENIRSEGGKLLLEFTQAKTKKRMTIPVPGKVREILDGRGGNFPRRITDQRYNEYIKEVAKAAGLNELCKGKRRENIAPEGAKAKYRDVAGEYPKWELVSSHIGRRSFATNHYGKAPTSVLRNITGHGTEQQFLNYIKKSNKDLALDAYDYFQ